MYYVCCMDTIKLEIKQDSVNEFVNNYVIADARDYERGPGRDVINPYYVFGKEEFLCKKSLLDLTLGAPLIKVTLIDRGQGSHRDLVNTYVYEIQEYDLIAVKLFLREFKVELK